MAARLSSATLPRTERILVSKGWLCARCFHASKLRYAEEVPSSPSPPSPPSTESPNAKSPRRARAARVSDALTAIASSGDTPSQNRSSGSRQSFEARPSRAKNPFGQHRHPPAEFPKPTRQSILQEGHGTATLGTLQFEGVVQDRLRDAFRPGVDTETFSHDGSLAELTPLELAYEMKERENTGDKPDKEAKERYGEFLSQNLIAGAYDPAGVLTPKEGDKPDDDAKRFAAKVKSLLPGAVRARPAPKPATT